MVDLNPILLLHEMKLRPPIKCGTTLETTRHPQKVQYKRFVSGPIPLGWLSRVARLSNKSLHVGIALWYLRYLTDSKAVKLTPKTLEIFGASRWTARRALNLMEEEKLVTVDSHAGRSPLVTIIDTEDITGIKAPCTPIDAPQTPYNRVPVVCGVNAENAEVRDV
jgi:hypothetical protein